LTALATVYGTGVCKTERGLILLGEVAGLLVRGLLASARRAERLKSK
jgi:hypothetical protein